MWFAKCHMVSFQVKYKHKYRYISPQASYALTSFGLTALSALTDYIVPQE